LTWFKYLKKMYHLIFFLTLIGCSLGLLFGRFLGPRVVSVITTSFVAIVALLSILSVNLVGMEGAPVYVKLMPWITSELLVVNWALQFDSLTVVMLVVVTVVSTLVHLYSISYMSADPHSIRFMSYLSLFTFFMIVLVTGDNYLQLFVGWEGVGLASYLLINFWYTRYQANKSAMKAMIVNRVGDVGVVLGMLSLFYICRSIDFATVFSSIPLIRLENSSYTLINIGDFYFDAITLISIFFLIGAVGKSAQIGLHTWLPDAMEGPTPVSALIHAATMVTAGVFLIIRSSLIFEYAPEALIVVTFVGALTAFFAATTGVLQNDIKKVIAYSTCSQLGYMIFVCGLSSYNTSLFHLANHAFFKALLFLGAGAIIHSLHDEQDMRRMGALVKLLPFTYTIMLIGSLSLMGFPFLTGFYSKDLILEIAYGKFTLSANFAYWLGTISAFFTSFYSFRLIYMTFLAKPNESLPILNNVHEAPILMVIPFVILAFGSIFIGYITKDMFVGFGTDFWNNAIFILPQNYTAIDAEFLPYYIKLIPVICSLFGATVAFILYRYFTRFAYDLQFDFPNVHRFLNQKWYFDAVYNEFIAQKFMYFGYNISFKTLDRGFVELFGPYGIVQAIGSVATRVSGLQTGLIYHYSFIFIFALTVLLFILFGAVILNTPSSFGTLLLPAESIIDLRLALIFLFTLFV